MVSVKEKLLELRWHGRGGQGVVTASNLLGEAALEEGKYFQSLPEFGAERSGAPLIAYTRVGTSPITMRSQVTEPDVVLVLDSTLIGRVNFISGLKASGLLLLNTPLSPEALYPALPAPVARLSTVDATRIAMETIGRNIPNVPMLGALLRVTGIVSREAALKAMTGRLGTRLGERILKANQEAFARGFQEVQGTQRADLPGKPPGEASWALPWQEVAPGALVSRPGSSREVETGSWGVLRPVVDWEKCVHCMICWIYCPDSCFHIQDQKLVAVDYQHCKGCGICALECPKRCITMAAEVPVAG